MSGRPLPNDFTVGARVYGFIRCCAGKMVSGDVADTAADGLYCVLVYFGHVCKNIWYLSKFRPVKLHVLSST